MDSDEMSATPLSVGWSTTGIDSSLAIAGLYNLQIPEAVNDPEGLFAVVLPAAATPPRDRVVAPPVRVPLTEQAIATQEARDSGVVLAPRPSLPANELYESEEDYGDSEEDYGESEEDYGKSDDEDVEDELQEVVQAAFVLMIPEISTTPDQEALRSLQLEDVQRQAVHGNLEPQPNMYVLHAQELLVQQQREEDELLDQRKQQLDDELDVEDEFEEEFLRLQQELNDELDVEEEVEERVEEEVEDRIKEVVEEEVEEQVRLEVEEQVRLQVGERVGLEVEEQVRLQVREQVVLEVEERVEEVEEQVRLQVGEQVRLQVREQVGLEVEEQVEEEVEERIEEEVEERIEEEVEEQQVRLQVGEQIGLEVEEQVEGEVEEQVRLHVREQIGLEVEEQVEEEVGEHVGMEVGEHVEERVEEEVEEQVDEEVEEEVAEVQVRMQVAEEVEELLDQEAVVTNAGLIITPDQALDATEPEVQVTVQDVTMFEQMKAPAGPAEVNTPTCAPFVVPQPAPKTFLVYKSAGKTEETGKTLDVPSTAEITIPIPQKMVSNTLEPFSHGPKRPREEKDGEDVEVMPVNVEHSAQKRHLARKDDTSESFNEGSSSSGSPI